MGQPDRAVSPSPRDSSADETCFGGALRQKPVGDKDGAIYGVGVKELCAGTEKRCDTPASAREGSDILSLDNDPISPSMRQVA